MFYSFVSWASFAYLRTSTLLASLEVVCWIILEPDHSNRLSFLFAYLSIDAHGTGKYLLSIWDGKVQFLETKYSLKSIQYFFFRTLPLWRLWDKKNFLQEDASKNLVKESDTFLSSKNSNLPVIFLNSLIFLVYLI